MRWTVAIALLAAGCSSQPGKHSLHATLTVDQAGGTVTMMCTASSSGTCHALFVNGGDIARISAAVGTSAGTSGITAATRYCLGDSEPADGCALKPLSARETIVRQQSTRT